MLSKLKSRFQRVMLTGLMGAIAFVVTTGPLPGCAVPPSPPPSGCEADADCDDANVCTADACDTDTGECSNTATEAAVIVSTSTEGDAAPGGTVTVTADAQVCDGSTTITGYTWTQSNSVAVTIQSPGAQSTGVLLPGDSVYKDELMHVLAEPPVTQDQLPETVMIPEGEFPGGLQDRFQVVGINPFALEEAGHVGLTVTVSTSSGDVTADVDIHTAMPFKPTGGIRNVPTGVPVLLHGRSGADTYDWGLAAASGSAATLSDATTQSPYFVPDVAGVYVVTATDPSTAETVTLEVYAGPWTGVVSGQDAEGRPEAASCTGCHSGTIAPDMFTPWAQTGHAEIFSANLDTSTHYGEGCFDCHTVGHGSGGIEDADDYQAFLDAGLLNVPGDNWTTVLADFPVTAQFANIQCENCHGPQGSSAHMQVDGSRITLSSDNCAVCHGEPLRHARFQQWQLSGHANYELAIDEANSGNCSRCHTANGFLAWLPALLDTDPDNDGSVDVTWTADETHPQTCVTCHDPHSVGTTTGVTTDATVRIWGDTPPLIAGFTVTDAGNGAICMTCHNSRRGLRNDDTWDGTDAARAPHGSSQTDVLEGQNAYFVAVGTPGAHAAIEDTCVACHMENTPPPDILAYNLGGTNHTFFAAPDICADCHGDTITAEMIQGSYATRSATLKGLIETAILNVMDAQIAAGNSLQFTLQDDSVVSITDTATIDTLEFGEYHGRQGINVTLTNGTELGWARLPDVRVLDGTSTDLGELYDFADDRLAKSGWNWNLGNNDGSQSVHYPSFITSVLNESITQMEALNAE